jgi:LuxR family transcriptional regulator, maltose regulon positive regulatory protein
VSNKKSNLAKISRPRLYDAVARERLFSLLDKHRQHPVMWLSGPPGAGKTTLLGSYIDAKKLSALWVQIDAGDIDVSTFFFYLGEAEKQVNPRRKRLPLLTAEHRSDLSGFSRRFGRAMFSRLPANSIVVLDNFQEASHDPTFLQVISELIAQIPETFTLVVISRRDPDLSFPLLVANQYIVVVPWQELRLSEDEALAIAETKTDVDPKVVKEVHARADGWAAGLILMLEAAKYDTSDLAGLRIQPQETLFAYFAHHTLNNVEPESRRFLAELSVLPRFTSKLAQEFTGEATASKLVEQLFKNHIFINCRFESEPQYEFHALFRSFLFDQLEAQTTVKELNKIRRRAGHLLATTGSIDEAIEVLLAAQDWESSADLLQRYAEKFYAHGRFGTISSWLCQFPETIFSQYPWLRYWQGVCTALTDLARGRLQLENAFIVFKQCSDELGQLLSAAQIIEIIYFQFEDFRDFGKWLPELERLDSVRFDFPSTEIMLQVLSAQLRAIIFFAPSDPLRLPLVQLLETAVLQKGEVNRRVSAALALVTHASVFGPLGRGRWVIDLIRKLQSSNDLAAVFRAYGGLTCGFWHFIDCDYGKAHDDFQTALDLAKDLNLDVPLHTAQVCLTYIQLATGRHIDVQTIVEKINALNVAQNPHRIYLISHLLIHDALKRQDKSALQKAITRSTVVDATGSVFLTCGQRIAAALGYSACGLHTEASKNLSDCIELSDGGYPGLEPAYHFTRAYAAIQQRNEVAVRQSLKDAFSSAKFQGGPGSLNWLFNQRSSVLSEALRLGVETETARDWISRMRLPCTDPSLVHWPWPIRIHVLGPLRILLNEQAIQFGRKAPRKPLATLLALIAFGGHHVSEIKLIDSIWPEEDGDLAKEALGVNIYRLRKLFGDSSAILVQNGLVSLNCDICWIDAVALTQLCETRVSDRTEAKAHCETVLAIYRGPLHGDVEEYTWLINASEQSRQHFGKALLLGVDTLMTGKKYTVAIDLLQRALAIDPLAEQLYHPLFVAYLKRSEPSKASQICQKFGKLFGRFDENSRILEQKWRESVPNL